MNDKIELDFVELKIHGYFLVLFYFALTKYNPETRKSLCFIPVGGGYQVAKHDIKIKTLQMLIMSHFTVSFVQKNS